MGRRRPTMLCASFLFLLLLPGCAKTEKSPDGKAHIVVVGIPADLDNLNPVFATELTAGEISELIYPQLVDAEFDTARGVLHFKPSLARSWEFRNNKKDVFFHLRADARWSDSVQVTATDVQFTYELYGDPELGSIRQSSLDNLQKSKDGSIDVRRSVEVQDDSTVIFHFEQASAGQLFDAGLPIIPSHIYKGIPRRELRTHISNRNPTGAGPFSLSRWQPMQEVVLVPNTLSVLPHPAKLRQLIFRILPDYRSRLAQLKSGEIDLMSSLDIDDARQLSQPMSIVNVVTIPDRRYHFVGWNNINGDVYAKSKGKSVQPHPLFGSPKVRRALTLALNREEMTAALLGTYGRVAMGPISSLFRWAVNDTLRPLPFSPQAAAALLSHDGWRDNDGDGILEKGKLSFSFKLIVPTGHHFYANIANIVQQQLRELKINVQIEQVEGSVLFQNLLQKNFEACIAGFEVPLQIQLDEFWGSDLTRYPFNIVSFRNKRVDELLTLARAVTNETDAAPYWKEFQAILQQEQPCTFLCWSSTIIGVNKRVTGTTIGILGTTHGAWKWDSE